MNRRTFLASILALGVSPMIVRASSLMPVRQRWVWIPPGEYNLHFLADDGLIVRPYVASVDGPQLWEWEMSLRTDPITFEPTEACLVRAGGAGQRLTPAIAALLRDNLKRITVVDSQAVSGVIELEGRYD